MTQMDTEGEEIRQRDPQTYELIGAAIEVHRRLGCGFLEGVYQEALAIELMERCIPFLREHDIPIQYRGRTLRCTYRADFVCFGEVIVELKALDSLTTRDHAQVINYLKATGLNRGLLFNFGSARLQIKRFRLD
jgi:GxxExxY protein